VLQPRADELAEDLLQRPHLLPLDPVVAEEIGSVLAALEAIDHDLAARGTTRAGAVIEGASSDLEAPSGNSHKAQRRPEGRPGELLRIEAVLSRRYG
jgi:hypothetical protein